MLISLAHFKLDCKAVSYLINLIKNAKKMHIFGRDQTYASYFGMPNILNKNLLCEPIRSDNYSTILTSKLGLPAALLDINYVLHTGFKCHAKFRITFLES